MTGTARGTLLRVGAAFAVLGGLALALLAPDRRLPLLPLVEQVVPIADSMFDGTSYSRLETKEGALRFTYHLRPGSTYPWAGVNLKLSDATETPLDFTGWQAIEMRCTTSPARGLRIQILSDDETSPGSARDSIAQIYHALEFQPDSLIQRLDWPTFSVPPWWRTQRGRGDLQRLDLLDRVRSIEFQNGYLPKENDAPIEVEIRQMDLVGANRRAQMSGIALIVAGLLAGGLSLRGFGQRKEPAEPPLPAPTETPTDPGWSAPAGANVVLDDPRAQQRTRLVEALGKAFPDPELGLESFAASQGLSPRLVATLLKEATNLHFKGVLNELRLVEAARLLRGSEANVSEIGYAVGFRNASHFGRAFRERFGVSPSEHREAP